VNRRTPSIHFARAAALALALALLLHGCTGHGSAPSPTPLSGRRTQADTFAARVSNRILAALVETNGVPGMGAAVWRDGAIVWTGSAGHRDRELDQRVDENTIFRLASVSKLFAATAAARLRQEGALDVDAPVRSIVGYLPDRWPAITTTQLAAHTAGIPHYQAVDVTRGRRRFATVREAVGIFQDRDLVFAPQTRYSYSSWGYTLLSAVVEESSRTPYLDYLSQRITPGLVIGPDATDSSAPNASRAYEFTGGVVRRAAPHDFSYSWGGAGLGATAPDLARFGGRLLAGEIVSRETFEWMLAPARLADGSNVMEGGDTVGFGWRSGRDGDGDRIAHHAGVTIGARSALILFPDRRLAVSVLSNASWVSAIEQTAIMLAAPFKATDAPAAVPCPTGAAAYEGEYNGKPVSGAARVAVQDGLCTAEISVQNAFGEWLNGFPQKNAETLTIIGLDPNGGFSRAALVTPAGVYDLRARDGGSRYMASLGGTRSISIRFGQP
jgi:CubicO group peptidase (beta-lactamase class C family)